MDTSPDNGDLNAFLSTKLSGHKKPVTCLDTDRFGSVLISGSSDRTCRLWDVKSQKTFKCIYGCFIDNIEMVKLASDGNIAYIQSGDTIQSFDLRFDGLLSKQSIASLQLNLESDEISTMALNSKGLLAIGMDSGNINIVHVNKSGLFIANEGPTRHRKLSRVHSNVLSTVLFRADNPMELLSGGFDYTVALWDVGRGRPKASSVLQPLDSAAGSTVVNPPFVMGLEYFLGNKYVVAAVGDGTIRLLSRDLQLISSVQAHQCMITALSCIGRCILTGGVDAKICAFVQEEGTSEALTLTVSQSMNKAARLQRAGRLESPPVLKRSFSISHSSKVNSIVSQSESSNTDTPSISLFVADITSDISVYSLKQ